MHAFIFAIAQLSCYYYYYYYYVIPFGLGTVQHLLNSCGIGRHKMQSPETQTTTALPSTKQPSTDTTQTVIFHHTRYTDGDKMSYWISGMTWDLRYNSRQFTPKLTDLGFKGSRSRVHQLLLDRHRRHGSASLRQLLRGLIKPVSMSVCPLVTEAATTKPPLPVVICQVVSQSWIFLSSQYIQFGGWLRSLPSIHIVFSISTKFGM